MLLEQINSPQDLKKLNEQELNILATELRTTILSNVAENGGHLASNLGVIELTIALHREFTSPQDRIVWDVGHQTYAHKILTGRRQRFTTLRKAHGLSGFPKREESDHDAFNTGHSTTSISAALGLAEALRLQGKHRHVIAIIGDGALTGGMAWEALNHASHIGKPLIVLLNDNEMSISPNVGAIAKYLNRLRTAPLYQRTKRDVRGVLKGIPRLGDFVSEWATRFKSSLKYLLVPGVVFEELGFTYLGPVDGHSMKDMEAVLRQAKQLSTPVLVHCLTRKGKGYLPAEDSPSHFHSAAPFTVATGERLTKTSSISFTELFGQTLVKLADHDVTITAITAAMLDGTGLAPFEASHAERLYDVGIAEQHAITFAAGLAAEGMKPVVVVYSTFMQRAYDQMLHDVCLQKLPVVLCLDRAGVVGEDGETHHGIYDLSYLRTMPGLTVYAPVGSDDIPRLLEHALGINAPVALRYPRDKANPVELPVTTTGEVLCGRGDILLVGVGPLLLECIKAYHELKDNDIATCVYYCPQVWPLPDDLIEKSLEARLIITLEDNILAGGFGSSLSEALAKQGAGNKIHCLGFDNGFVQQAPRQVLLAEAGLSAAKIREVVEEYEQEKKA